ncbi:hypothetical protein HBI52_238380 [Parastagonospora nodorum]|nr:hypothetical protein HBH82_217250 [Parastagonospora nodorum]KAH4658773.1 hypothetical protein HBH78_236840 [Parastagonospora nodorum]KAH4694427.1 hypothetical protein HBH67_213750 [Parastagonospora nodorum]KAH4770570.1 hypothetical protein HBH62_218660 [Parastagonospora nodorum]KAH5170747.1 hypothetical protein HBH68_216270 [Parastagonospora nodorum]
MCVVDTVCDCDKLIVMMRAGISDDRGASERGDGKQHHMSGANPLRARKLRECTRSFTYLRGSTRTVLVLPTITLIPTSIIVFRITNIPAVAFVLTLFFAPAYQAQQCNPFSFCPPVSRFPYAYRVACPRPQRPQNSPFNHFIIQEPLSEIDRGAQRQTHIEAIEVQREARRQAHRQRQHRQRALRANFAVNQTEQGWQIDGETQGFDQENISIEVTDEHTLKHTC